MRLARVHGQSMRPTLQEGQVLLVRLRSPGSPISNGALVIADLPGERGLGVKRVSAREGDGWWLERDNPTQGSDSWLFGVVADGAVLARVVARVWPRPRRMVRNPGW